MHKYFVFLSLVCIANIVFAKSPTVIPEVTVGPQSQIKLPINNTTGQAIHYNRKQIANSPNTSLRELLQNQSIVRIANNSGNSYQSALSIRGFGDNAGANSLILVDGFPLINSSLLTPNLNALLLSDMQQLTIFPGSQGSLWGDQAVGGVLDINTLHPNKRFGAIDLAYGSYNRQFLSGIYANKLANNIFYKISGYTNRTNNYRAHNQQTSAGISAQEGWDYATGTLSFIQKFYEDIVNYPGSLSQDQYNDNPAQATDTSDYFHYKTQIYQLLNKQALNDNWLLETRFSSTHILTNGFFMSPFRGNESLNWFNPKLIGNLKYAKLTLGYAGQTSHYENFSTPAASSIADATENDVFGQAVIPLAEKWKLTLGARSAWQNNNPQIIIGQPIHYRNYVFVTEQGIAYHPTSSWTLYLRRDGNFRFPKTNEEVWLPTNVTQLKPQTGVSYETGAQWHTAQQQAQISFYELWLKNEIAYDPTQTPTQPFGATHNFDATLRKGISFTEQATLNKYIELNSQLNYVNAQFVAGPYSGHAVPAVPKWNGIVGINYQFLSHWKTGYSEHYIGAAYASNDVANAGKKAPSYWLGQWSLQYFAKAYSVSFTINNVFNQRYAVYTIYNLNAQEDAYYPGAGRNYLLSLKVNLA